MIALVDCNNFYASCERIFRPHLTKKPVAVLSNNDGCVIARSNESKSLGLKMGEPIFKKRYLVDRHNIHLFSSNFALYGDISKRVFDIVARDVPAYEIYSIDEAFLDFSGIKDPYNYAIHLRDKVRRWTGVPISIGISYTKTLSKVAGHIAKKSDDGVCYLKDKSQISDILGKLPLDEIWGVGVRYAIKLKKYGIHTASDLLECDETWVRKMMNVVGLRMVRELKCIPHFNLEEDRSMKKSICTSRSFSVEVKEYSRMSEYVSMFASRCSEKLRSEQACARSISVFMYTNRFRPRARQYSGYFSMDFHTASSDAITVTKLAIECLKKIFKSGYSYKKAGVTLSGIVPRNQVQLSLFDSSDRKKSDKLMETMDAINGNMGRDILKLSSSGINNKWKIGKERLSPCYTTRWSDILKIKV
ncbi:MAG: SOS mutagenesis and repair protein UmuC [Cytophagia bacterium]|nr:SOS mutagenesis and repair protein UmuC [Cytophagia bacterium]|tara:strand:+ start:181 stop:1431 length:1251 start_codon:yes stop_codon:yes gene_type:complete